METKENKMPFGLIQISKNRYKVNSDRCNFSRENARKIPGCYYSGVQRAWVFPISEQNRRIFTELMNQNTVEPVRSFLN